MKPYIIYGSGDSGSAELVSAFQDLNIPYFFLDIRVIDNGVRGNLTKLLREGVTTVPQVWAGDGVYVGDFEATVRLIAA